MPKSGIKKDLRQALRKLFTTPTHTKKLLT